MKIIKEGQNSNTIYRGICEECGCEFECERKETIVGNWRYATCPCCKSLVQVQNTETK